jgi:hypothetical protein
MVKYSNMVYSIKSNPFNLKQELKDTKHGTPKLLHYVWLTDQGEDARLPDIEKNQKNINDNLKKLPVTEGWKYILWTNAKLRDTQKLLDKYIDSEFLSYFEIRSLNDHNYPLNSREEALNLWKHGVKGLAIDLLKYDVVYSNGGVIMDFNFSLNNNLSHHTNSFDFFTCKAKIKDKFMPENSFFAADKNHEALGKLISTILKDYYEVGFHEANDDLGYTHRLVAAAVAPENLEENVINYYIKEGDQPIIHKHVMVAQRPQPDEVEDFTFYYFFSKNKAIYSMVKTEDGVEHGAVTNQEMKEYLSANIPQESKLNKEITMSELSLAQMRAFDWVALMEGSNTNTFWQMRGSTEVKSLPFYSSNIIEHISLHTPIDGEHNIDLSNINSKLRSEFQYIAKKFGLNHSSLDKIEDYYQKQFNFLIEMPNKLNLNSFATQHYYKEYKNMVYNLNEAQGNNVLIDRCSYSTYEDLTMSNHCLNPIFTIGQDGAEKSWY